MDVRKYTIPGPNQRFSAQDMERIAESTQRVFHGGDARGIGVNTIGGTVSLDMGTVLPNPANVLDSFLGRIVTEGPNAEDDYEDSRYWVKELTDAVRGDTPDHARLLTEDMRDWLIRSELYDPGDPENSEHQPARWLTATNIDERLSPDDESSETHVLVAVTDPLVHVHGLFSKLSGQPQWWFSRGVSSVGITWFVIRDIPDLGGNKLTGSPLLHNDTDPWDGGYVIDDERVFDAFAWPFVKAGHYRQWMWGGEPGPACTALPLCQIEGAWHVQQLPKYAFPYQDERFDVAGCLPVVIPG